MKTEDQVVSLFAAANPVADPGILIIDASTRARLQSVEQWSSDVVDTTRNAEHATEPKQGGMRQFAVAAAVVMLVGIGAVWLASRSDDPAPVAVAPEVEIVEAAYEALNRGDLDGYLSLLTDEAAQGVQQLEQILINANEVNEIVEPCRVTARTADGEATVVCGVNSYDDFHGPAGISSFNADTVTVDATGKIAAIDNEVNLDRQFEFNRKFWLWMMNAHPDVFDEIRPIDGDSLPGWNRDPADMLVAIEYVEEFVAQSDDYPLDETGE